MIIYSLISTHLKLFLREKDKEESGYNRKRGQEQINLLSMTLTGICVCVEVLRPSQPNGVMSSAVRLPNHTFTGQA